MDNKPDKYEVLKNYFGYESFRPGQEEIIDNLLMNKDVLAVMPTGGGKSVCFQVPALMKHGTAIVISPLISLMEDQISTLLENGINAVTINSSLDFEMSTEIFRQAYRREYTLIYVSPERLDYAGFRRLAERIDISMVCIDEAHCVSQWGQDFRSSYLKIPEFISRLKKRPVVAAFTATATQRVRDDIIRLLDLREPKITVTGFDRKNLYFEVQKPEDKIVSIKKYLDAHIGSSGIIYCSTRKQVEDVWIKLLNSGYNATRYHAGLDLEERQINQNNFILDRKKIMVATNAFGMGIDKPNVSFVIHYNIPGDIESYYQEAGRAGRDGEPAECILLYSPKDIRVQKYFIENPSENEEMTEEEIEEIKRRKSAMLKDMIAYGESRTCLRNRMLNYFGEKPQGSCGNCSSCCGLRKYSDITITAQKILSAVARTKERLYVYQIIEFLRGDSKAVVLDPSFSQMKTFGIMSDISEENIRIIIDDLLKENVVEMGQGDKSGVLCLNENSRDVLFNGKRVHVKEKKRKLVSEKTAVDEVQKEYICDLQLFSLLKNLRKTIANKKAVPAYVIFPDATLKEMATKVPVTYDQFRQIKGVGSKKAEVYGAMFMKAIKLYLNSREEEARAKAISDED